MISGDAHFFIKHKGSFNNTNICRFSVNTGFIDNELVIPRDQISPDSVSVSKKFHEKFQITLVMRDYCEECTNKSLIGDVCERCKLRMSKTTKEWRKIYKIIDNHMPYPDQDIGEKLCFYDIEQCDKCKEEGIFRSDSVPKCPHIDYYEVTNKQLAVKVDQYNLIKDQATLNSIKEVDEDNYDAISKSGGKKLGDDLRKRSEDDFKPMLSKADRNTYCLEGDKLEEEKEVPEEYTRSFNEFSATYVTKILPYVDTD